MNVFEKPRDQRIKLAADNLIYRFDGYKIPTLENIEAEVISVFGDDLEVNSSVEARARMRVAWLVGQVAAEIQRQENENENEDRL